MEIFTQTENIVLLSIFCSWIFQIQILKTNSFNSNHPKTLPWVMRGPTQKLGPIDSAVLTFIGYKQTKKQKDRPAAKYI